MNTSLVLAQGLSLPPEALLASHTQKSMPNLINQSPGLLTDRPKETIRGGLEYDELEVDINIFPLS
jgi:hypothetical protein